MEFLLLFACQEFEDFREAEFLSLLDLSKINFDRKSLENHNWSDNFLVVHLESVEDAKKLIDRSILIKCAYEIWIHDTSLDSFCVKLSAIADDCTEEMISNKSTYCLNIEPIHKKFKTEEKIKFIETVLGTHKQLSPTELKLSQPDVELGLILDYPYDKQKGCVTAIDPSNLFYGRLVGVSQRLKIMAKYKMSQRKFIGNTSMDVKLSFLMANLGRITPHQIVLDPFVGTGSILVAAAHFGAQVMGTDIDYKVIYGKGKSSRADQTWRADEECLRLNFQQYGIESKYGDVFVGDSSRLDRILRPDFRFDSILTDPPYGIRERSRKLAATEERRPYIDDKTVQHFPMKESYDMSLVFQDLVSLSAKRLMVGGFLVMWIPLVRSLYTGAECLPRHETLTLIQNCEQILNKRTSRRLLVYRKDRDENQVNGTEVEMNNILFEHEDQSIREAYFNKSQNNCN